MNEKDDLLDAVYDNWCGIMKLYKVLEKTRPVLLFDLQEQRVYAYSCTEFSAQLNERSRQTLKAQYEAAGKVNEMVIFVRDNVGKRFRSYSISVA